MLFRSENDYLFVSKQSYTFGEPKRGDVVVFHSSLVQENGDEKLLIKRIVGLPGETIDISDGKVYINGEELKEEVNRHLKDRFSITIEIIDPHTGKSETTAVENPVQEESQPEPQTDTGAPTTSQPETAAPQTSGDSDYDPGSDGVTEYSQPEPQPVQPAAPVYSEEGESDYDEENEDEGESDYEEDEEDD